MSDQDLSNAQIASMIQNSEDGSVQSLGDHKPEDGHSGDDHNSINERQDGSGEHDGSSESLSRPDLNELQDEKTEDRYDSDDAHSKETGQDGGYSEDEGEPEDQQIHNRNKSDRKLRENDSEVISASDIARKIEQGRDEVHENDEEEVESDSEAEEPETYSQTGDERKSDPKPARRRPTKPTNESRDNTLPMRRSEGAKRKNNKKTNVENNSKRRDSNRSLSSSSTASSSGKSSGRGGENREAPAAREAPFERLYRSQTFSSSAGEVDRREVPKDTISRPPVSEKERQEIHERLHSKQTRNPKYYKAPKAKDVITRSDIELEEVERISDRLHKTETISFSGHATLTGPRAVDEISREVSGEGEIRRIVKRLYSSNTKSSAATPCRPTTEQAPVGYGTKAYPRIPGIESRFKGGKTLEESKMSSSIERLHSTHTQASKTRLDAPVSETPALLLREFLYEKSKY